MYHDLPHGFFELQSTVSETGTVYYADRADEPLSARRLTNLWAGQRAATVPLFVEAFEEFIDYADFSTDRFNGYDYHDLFFWEHRSRWAADKYQVGDLSHRVLLPFNARAILEAMLAVPYEHRRSKYLLVEYAKGTLAPG